MNLAEAQRLVRVSKDHKNDFGGYSYRTAEGILAVAKAALPDNVAILPSDTIQEVAGEIFVTATVKMIVDGEVIAEAQGHAMHPLQKKGMDAAQITGSCSSYARKYALQGLFGIDDGSVDPDVQKPSDKPFADAILDQLPANASQADAAVALVEAIKDKALAYKKKEWLDKWMKARREDLDFASAHAPEQYSEARVEILAYRETL